MVAPASIAQNVKNKINMKLIPVIIIALLIASCSHDKIGSIFKSDQNQASQLNQENIKFIEGSDDIPLFSPLVKVEEGDVDFDSTSGSVSSLIYESTVCPNKVRKFYVETMPQMGWRLRKNSQRKIIFYRQNQKFEIELVKENNRNLVKFLIVE